MKVKAILLIFALLLTALLIQGCATTTNAIVCNKPYILVGASCCLDSNNNNICDKDEVQKPVENPPVTPPSTNPPVEVQNDFKLIKGESVSVAGKKLTLVDFSVFQGRFETVVDVDGATRTLYGTKEPEIFNGLRITPLTVDRLQSYIEIEVEPLELGADEYLLDFESDKVILGRLVRLLDVQDDDGILVEVVDGDVSAKVFIMPGETKTVGSLKVTNFESFHRIVRMERYAILKISPA